jgi:hypothetical protein
MPVEEPACRWSLLTGGGARSPVYKPARRWRRALVEEPLVDGSQRRQRRCLIDDPQSLGDGRWVTVTKLHWNGGGAWMWRGRVGVVALRSGGDGSPRRRQRMDSSARDFWIWNRMSALGFGLGVGVWVYMAPRPPGQWVWDWVRGTWLAGPVLGATKLCWSGCAQQQ